MTRPTDNPRTTRDALDELNASDWEAPACVVCGAGMYQDEDMPQLGWSCPECGAIDDEVPA
jgi:rubrerythrin